MSLDWNVTGIENHDEICFVEEDGKRRLNPVTEMLILATVVVGIGPEIDNHHIDEFVARVMFMEKVNGTFLKGATEDDWVDRPLTEEEIRAHVGLRTNVLYEPRETFLERVTRSSFPDREPNTKIYWVSFADASGVYWDGEVTVDDGENIEQLARKQAEDEGCDVPTSVSALGEEI